MKKLLFLVSEDHYFCSHRLNLAKAALAAGFEVALATRCHEDTHKIHEAGIKLFPLKRFTRAGLNPFLQFLSILEIYKIYKNYRPDIVHHVAVKPIILGSWIAYLARIPKIINALGGLGYLFTETNAPTVKKNVLKYIVCLLFKWSFSKPNSITILQNQDDLNALQENAIHPHHAVIIRGAGVDINVFPVTPHPSEPPIIIACVSRLLWSKGIQELIDATKRIKKEKFNVEVLLYGMPDLENPASIEAKQLDAWQTAKLITWKKHCNDVARAYANCHIAVLPSYREGLPKSLLEAASCGRSIVTTNVAGCKEVVEHEENGLLVPPQDSRSLADALIRLIQDKSLRMRMGAAGRTRVEQFFSDQIIHKQTIALYEV